MAKVASKDLVFKVGSPLATLGIFDPNIDESADEIEVTDSDSTAKEYLSGFTGRTIGWARWYSDADTPLEVGDEEAFSLKLGAKTFTGTVIVTGRKISASQNDAVRYDYTGRVSGALNFA